MRFMYRNIESCGKTSGAGMHKGATGMETVDPVTPGQSMSEVGGMGRLAQCIARMMLWMGKQVTWHLVAAGTWRESMVSMWVGMSEDIGIEGVVG